MFSGGVLEVASLGERGYDFAEHRHGPITPVIDMAGELSAFFIRPARQCKREEEYKTSLCARELEDNGELIAHWMSSTKN